jgi:hypothetical protein
MIKQMNFNVMTINKFATGLTVFFTLLFCWGACVGEEQLAVFIKAALSE